MSSSINQKSLSETCLGAETLELQDQVDSPEEHGNIKCKDFDDILEIVGSTSKYQRIFLYGILFPLSVFESIFAINLWFLLDEPKHWCHVPGGDEIALEAWKNLTIPRNQQGDFEKCLMFGANESQTSCNAGWDYDFSTADYHSILTDYNWVCDKSHWSTYVHTANNVGRSLGTLLLGYLADKIGRKPVFIITLVLYSVGRAVSLYFASDIWIFVSLTLITGISAPMFAISINTIGVELSGKDYRAWIYSFTWATVVIGLLTVPAFAMFVAPNWFVLGWITILLGSISYLFLPWIPESPRWLLSVGKVDEVAKILRKIAQVNGTTSKLNDKDMLEMLTEIQANNQDQNGKGEEQCKSVLELFSKRRVAMHTMIITFVWVMNGLVFHGLNLNSLNLHGHRYFNYILIILMEVPGGFLGGILSDKFGRRWSQVTFFLVCGIACSCAAYFSSFASTENSSTTVSVIIAANVAKFAITMSFLVIYIQAVEIFPTPLRTTGSGLASTTSSITIILVPYIVYTGKTSLITPWIVSAVMSFAGMIAAAFIPETMNHHLPETIEEADNFGKNRKFWSIHLPSNQVEK